MKLILSLFVLILMSACEHVDQSEETDIPTSFKPYQEHFSELFDVPTSCKISFGDLRAGRPGRTIYQTYQVQINYDIWKDLTEEGRVVLILHELGHCELGLHHVEGQHIMSDFIGTQVLVYRNNLEEEIEFMLSESHPKILSVRE